MRILSRRGLIPTGQRLDPEDRMVGRIWDPVEVALDGAAELRPVRGNDLCSFFAFDLHRSAAAGRRVKVILENAYLTDAQKRLACRLAARAGAAYVKTSTGFAPYGATSADVALMRRTVPRSVGVKAAGGIRTYADAVALLHAGADLLRTSATEAILSDAAREAA